jgi:alginate O-acetyltransferase complex protein AlgI
MLTMLLGGLWHGAGWTYVIWGGLHGIYLTINHGWRVMRAKLSWLPRTVGPVEVFLGRGLTFLAVVVGWVFFRAADFETAIRVLHAMWGANGLDASPSSMVSATGMLVVGGLLLIAWLAPNTQELVDYEGPTVGAIAQSDTAHPKVTWQPTLRWAVIVGGLTAVSIMSLSKVSEFIYFQF